MKSYDVGQRVKVIYVNSETGRRFLGCEAVIAEKADVDGTTVYGLDIAPIMRAGWEVWGWASNQLEPILPSGQVAVTLEQLLSVPGLESLDKILGVKA